MPGRGQVRTCSACASNNHFRRTECINCRHPFKQGRPHDTSREDGYSVSLGRPAGTTKEAGYCVSHSGGRPRGTTQKSGCCVSEEDLLVARKRQVIVLVEVGQLVAHKGWL